MNWIGYFLFLGLAVSFIWNGKDFFNKKEWLLFGLKFIGVFAGIAISSVILKNILIVWPLINTDVATDAIKKSSMSFICVLSVKFMVVMICRIFSTITGFHEKYNQANYSKIVWLSEQTGTPLLSLAKCLATAGGALMLYGVWLAQPLAQ
ncbi:hypothetical protein [Erwinia sp. CGal63]|uniref:hypothetical protein n=1 Tax=Erwinia sp. CGal63 TaxID=2919889 RepID=UPI003008024B